MFLCLCLLSLFSDRLLKLFGFSKYYVLSIITAVVFAVPALLLRILDGRKAKAFLKLKKFRLRWLVPTIFIAVTVSLASMLLNAILYTFLKGAGFSYPLNPVSGVEWTEPFAAMLALIFVPAIFEELFFRGAFISAFGENSKLKALFAGAISFAVFHSTPYNFLGPLLAGIVYGFMVLIFDSVYPAILAHIIHNSLACAFSFYAPKLESSGLEAAAAICGMVMLFVFLYFSLATIEPFIKKGKGKQKLPLSQRLQVQKNTKKVFTVSFYILLFLWLLKMIAVILGIWG